MIAKSRSKFESVNFFLSEVNKEDTIATIEANNDTTVSKNLMENSHWTAMRINCVFLFYFYCVLTERSRAAFLVSLSTDVNIPDNTVVPFDVIHYDKGSNYNISTNTYIVPRSGTYLFYAVILCVDDDNGGCGNYLLVDGDSKAWSNKASSLVNTNPWSKLVVSWQLTQGQNVQLETANGNDIVGNGAQLTTYFGGHLLFSDN